MLHGFDSDHNSWLQHTRIEAVLAEYRVITVFPQGDNGWYTNAFIGGTGRHEDDLICDLIPELRSTLPVAGALRHWAIGGMSMGGYGSVKLAVKYPEVFGTAFSHGGAFERMFQNDVHPVFGDPVENAAFRRQESPVWLLEQLMCRFPIYRPRLFIDCGLQDPLLEVNRRFTNHLEFLGYHHSYRESPGHHTWPYWNRAFRQLAPQLMGSIGAKRCEL